MYRMSDDYRFQRTVEVRRPSQTERDKIELDTFVAHFVALEADDLDAFEDQLAAARTAKDAVAVMIDFASRVTVGWDEVLDVSGNPVTFAAEPYREHLRRAWFRDGVIAAYRAAMRGEEARRGN